MSLRNLDFNEKILLILYYSKIHTTLITRAMKLMFLLEEIFELKGESDLDFISYNLGPFAVNFQTNITPLITEQLISYEEVFDKNSNFIPLDSKRLYQINPERKKEIETVLKDNYINNSDLKKEIKLIKILSVHYDHEHLTDLIQLCYYLKPKFTQKSIIKEQIKAHSKFFNQEVILKMIYSLDEGNIIKLFSNLDGILNLFCRNEKNIEKEHFYSILGEISQAIKAKSQINKKHLVFTIDNISINDPDESYKFLKYKLLEVLTFEKTHLTSLDSKKEFLKFFLKSLQLNYPLNKASIEKLRLHFNELKNSLEFIDYKDQLPELEINYEEFKNELRSIKKEEKKQIIRRDKTTESKKIEEIQTKITDFKLIEEIDEFSEKDDIESIKITGEDHHIFVDFKEKIEI